MSLLAESSATAARVGRRQVSGSLWGDCVWAQSDRRQELMAELTGNAICQLEQAGDSGFPEPWNLPRPLRVLCDFRRKLLLFGTL